MKQAHVFCSVPGLLLRFIFALTPHTDNDYQFVSDGLVGPNRHSKGYWLTNRYSVIQSFIKENILRTINFKARVRSDLADHIISLYRIRIVTQLKTMNPGHIINKRAIEGGKGSIVGAILDFQSKKPSNYVDIEIQPTYYLRDILGREIVEDLKKVPIFDNESVVGVVIEAETTPLLVTLYRARAYLT